MPILKNPKHERFCQLYIVHGNNASKAYEEAGYSATGDAIRINASKLLTNANIKERIKELQLETEEKELITREGLIEEMNELKATAKADNQLNIVAKVLEMQGKMIGSFTEKREVVGNIKVESPLAKEIAEMRAKRGK